MCVNDVTDKSTVKVKPKIRMLRNKLEDMKPETIEDRFTCPSPLSHDPMREIGNLAIKLHQRLQDDDGQFRAKCHVSKPQGHHNTTARNSK